MPSFTWLPNSAVQATLTPAPPTLMEVWRSLIQALILAASTPGIDGQFTTLLMTLRSPLPSL